LLEPEQPRQHANVCGVRRLHTYVLWEFILGGARVPLGPHAVRGGTCVWRSRESHLQRTIAFMSERWTPQDRPGRGMSAVSTHHRLEKTLCARMQRQRISCILQPQVHLSSIARDRLCTRGRVMLHRVMDVLHDMVEPHMRLLPGQHDRALCAARLMSCRPAHRFELTTRSPRSSAIALPPRAPGTT